MARTKTWEGGIVSEKPTEFVNWQGEVEVLRQELLPLMLEAEGKKLTQQISRLKAELGYQDEPTKPLSTKEMVDAFLESKRGMIAVSSVETYGRVLRAFAREFPDLPLQPEPIEQFLKSKPTLITAKDNYTVLRTFYRWLNRRFSIPNVMGEVEKPKPKRKEQRSLSWEEWKRLLDEAEKSQDKRLAALVYLCGGQGWHKSEALRINIGDWADDKINVMGKEGREWPPLLLEVRGILSELTNGRPTGQPAFISNRGKRLSPQMADVLLRQLYGRAGLGDVKRPAHTLRHTFATLATEAGCDTHSLKRLLRHSLNRDVTDNYQHPSFEAIKKKLETYSPLRLVKRELEKDFK